MVRILILLVVNHNFYYSVLLRTSSRVSRSKQIQARQCNYSTTSTTRALVVVVSWLYLILPMVSKLNNQNAK